MKGFTILAAALAGVAAAVPASDASDAKHKSTLTYTATKTITHVATVTGHSTVYTTTTFTRPGVFPVYHYVYNETLYDTYTSTASAGTLVRPSSTVTAKTSAGFTPLKQESVYTDDISIVKTTVQSTSTTTYDPSPTTTPGTFVQVYGTFTTLTTTGPSYVVTSVTVTSTSTSMPPVYTKYDACSKDNLAKKIPTGQPLDSIGEYGESGYDVIFTDSAEDCCAYCQEVGGCFGGSWETGPQADFPGRCFVFTIETQNNQTCDGSIPYGVFGHNVGSNNTADTAFNGPCGQLKWQFQSGDYV